MDKHLLIGSRALNYWFPEHKIRPETDWDVITHSDLYGIEKHDPDFLNNKAFEQFTCNTHRVLYRGYWLHVVNPGGLAIIKRSHLWRNIGFDKHITQYCKYLRQYNVLEHPLLRERTEMTRVAFPQQHPKLNVSVPEFFDDYVTKKYDHDWLHTLVAHETTPLYKQMQTDPESAWCDKSLWDGFTYQQKVNCVSEEVYVIAIERFLVPSDWNYSPKVAYHKALNKVCTTLCSGWFRDFAIDNYEQIYDNCNISKFAEVKLNIERNENE